MLNSMPSFYAAVYKPFHVLTQFSASDGKNTLAGFFTVPKDVYPLGRLDYDSEGLLLLTNDSSVNQRLLHPAFAHQREYYVQVEGVFTQAAAALLKQGVDISVDGKKMKTKPAQVTLFSEAPELPERNPPIRYRKNIPATWISIILTEGKNRQVRKMTAQTGFPTLRLVRWRIGMLTLDGMQPGDMRILTKEDFFRGVFSPMQ